MKNILNTINTPKDLKPLSVAQLQQLAQELRSFIINIVATKEGHLGASLGVVELTIAIHYIFNTPKDQLIWDVGHQAYGHKILTGRKDIFETNRRLNGISGFPNIYESEFDSFGTGHSSTSISAALGMAMAAKIQGNTQQQHIAVIGDASIASGMAFEALNHAGVTNANLLVILNDNAIGIDPSIGALKDYLTKTKNGKELNRDNIFEALNFDYSGPIDGHDLPLLIKELKRLQNVNGPKFLHVVTTKGKGLKKAEEDQITYHAPGKFNAITGDRITKINDVTPPKYQDVFGYTIIELAEKNKNIVGITPAMPTGSSLKYMIAQMPDRAFDVGIAEQHAVTLAAGMAKQGLVPFCNIYSTFLQRAYDQVIHDVAIQKLPVIFCLDRSGLVGNDGATHHGVFDIPFLRCIPNLILYAPMNEVDLRNIMYTAQKGLKNPIAIRYPRGNSENISWKQPFKQLTIGKGRTIKEGNNTAVLSIGTIGNVINLAIDKIIENNKNKVGHYNMQFIKPLDHQLLHYIFSKYSKIVTYEDGVIAGGFGSAILEFAAEHAYHQQIILKGIPDKFIEHGKTQELKTIVEIDETSIYNTILSTL